MRLKQIEIFFRASINLIPEYSKKELTNDIIFYCERCDLRGYIFYSIEDWGNVVSARMRGVAEMIGYHAVNILPELNGFSGYDCLNFESITPKAMAKLIE